MFKCFPKKPVTIFIVLLLSGCSTIGKKPVSTFTPIDLNPNIRTGHYLKKIDNFLIIFDSSWSMRDPHEGFFGQSKLKYAKELVRRMNLSIPHIKINAGFRIFGLETGLFSENTAMVYSFQAYSGTDIEKVLQTIRKTGWTSPLPSAITAAGVDIKPLKGKTAIIIISDGIPGVKNTIRAAQDLKALLGDKICIYTVVIRDNDLGIELMEKIAGVCDCGFAVAAKDIASPENMSNFVKDVFLKGRAGRAPVNSGRDKEVVKIKEVIVRKAPVPVPIPIPVPIAPVVVPVPKTIVTAKEPIDNSGDQDGDGISNVLDKCPGSPKGTLVDEEGCDLSDFKSAEITSKGSWIFRDIHFAANKWTLKKNMLPALNKVTSMLKNNPKLVLVIEGHTNNIGTMKRNKELSQNRAQAVMGYFVKKGLPQNRLAAVGYGFAQPIASNGTPEGRAKNRRVEFVPIR